MAELTQLGSLDSEKWLDILKFEELPDPNPDQDSKILEQERNLSLKKCLLPLLISAVCSFVSILSVVT